MVKELKLVDRVEGRSYQGSKKSIIKLLQVKFNEYKYYGLLKGVVLINNTWYIG